MKTTDVRDFWSKNSGSFEAFLVLQYRLRYEAIQYFKNLNIFIVDYSEWPLTQ